MESATEKPTVEQMQQDAPRLVKFRGYCRKVHLALVDLPNNNSYSTLHSIMYRRGLYFERSSEAISGLSRCARRIEAWIDEAGGPRLKPYPELKTWPDDNRRPYERFQFDDKLDRVLSEFIQRNQIEDERFAADLACYMNSYCLAQYERYEDSLNRDRVREDDLDKLETLERKIVSALLTT